LIVTTSLTVIALLAFAVSVLASLVQTSKHRPSRGWIVAAGTSLILVLVSGGKSQSHVRFITDSSAWIILCGHVERLGGYLP
jgi:hypothetical protein